MNMQELTDWLPSHPPIWCNADLESGLAHIADKAMAIQVAADADGRALTEAEVREITDLSNQFQTLEARLQGHNDAQAAIQRMTRTGVGRKTTAEGPGAHGQYSERATVEPGSLQALQRQPFRGRGPVDLWGAAQEKSPFKNFGEMLDLVVRNVYDPRLIRNAAGMSESVESDGGWFVPIQYSYRLFEAALEQSVLYGRVRVEPMVSKTKEVASFYNPSTTTNSPFGLSIQWLAESGSYSLQKAKTNNILLSAKKGGILVPVSQELLDDAGGSFVSQLENVMGQSLAWGIDLSIIEGIGAGQPLGILNSPSLISCAKQSGQLATLVFDNIVDMFSRMMPSCMSDAIWLANPSTLPQLLTMTVATGSTGMWYPALNENSGNFSLLGKPLYLTEKCSQLGDKGDIYFLSPSKYVFGLRRDLTISVARDLGFQTDEIYLKLNLRCDGMPEMSAPYTPREGNTLSWAVALDAR